MILVAHSPLTPTLSLQDAAVANIDLAQSSISRLRHDLLARVRELPYEHYEPLQACDADALPVDCIALVQYASPLRSHTHARARLCICSPQVLSFLRPPESFAGGGVSRKWRIACGQVRPLHFFVHEHFKTKCTPPLPICPADLNRRHKLAVGSSAQTWRTMF